MREIKFRAWDKVQREIYGGDNVMRGWDWLVDKQGTYFNSKYFDVMQYTGFHDKNGKEIYEGDIVRTRFKGNKVVKWELLPSDEGWEGIEGYGFEDYGDVEVIGNIYENPELTK